ncbi:MAG: methyl-accepting chemotaxis protein [Prochloraceae cyanobacterium]|nr:methyl-accepting chemotaxis protein [Prochloraceae cyanobacterium]
MTKTPPQSYSEKEPDDDTSLSKTSSEQDSKPLKSSVGSSVNRSTEKFQQSDRISLDETKAKQGKIRSLFEIDPKKMWSRLGLRLKATAVGLALSILPVAIVGGISYSLASQSMRRQIISEQEGRTIDIGNEITVYIQGVIVNIKALASSPLLVDPQFNNTVLKTEKIALLDSLMRASNGKYENIAIFDRQGNLQVQSNSSEKKDQYSRYLNYSKLDSLKLAFERKSLTLGIPQIDKSTGDIILEAAAPIIEKGTERILGAVVFRISPEKLESIFDNIIADGWEYKLIHSEGKEGKIFITDEEWHLGNHAEDDFDGFEELETKVLQEEKKGKQVFSQPVATNKLYDKSDDDRYYSLVSLTRLKQLESIVEPNWRLSISRPVQIAFATEKQLGSILILGSSIAAVVVGAIAAILANRAIRPILEAAGAVEKIGRGNFQTRLSVERSDEIAKLFGNINRMARQLEKLLESQKGSLSQSRFLAHITGVPVFNRLKQDKLFEEALTKAREILGVERSLIYCIDPNGKDYVAYESVADSFPSALSLQIEDSFIAQELLEEYCQGHVVATEDVSLTNWHPKHQQLLEQLQVKANLVAPILQQEKLYGLLIVHNCQNTHSWSSGEINFVKQLAAQLGVTLERLALLEEREQQVRRSQLLKDITLQIANYFEPQQIYNSAVRQLQDAFQLDRVIVYSWSEEDVGKVIAEAVEPSDSSILGNSLPKLYSKEDCTSQYIQGQVEAISSKDRGSLIEEKRQQLEELGIKANLVAPILVDGSLEALLILQQCSQERQWEDSEIEFAYQVATQVGLALDRSNLLEQQRIAKEQLEKRALELLQEVDPISEGDLTVYARVTPDEIGTVADFYNATIESLRVLVTQVKVASTQVATTTKANQSAVKNLSTGAQQQTRDIEAALARIQAMAESISRVAANAASAAKSVQKASTTVSEGEAAMKRTVEGMVAIRETVADTAEKLKRLGVSSQKISKVVNLIKDFADQTNLLALNASIEAAHAGEQGKGFAVVADEIRSLAQKSAKASSEIEQIVASIEIQTQDVVAAMEEGTSQAIAGTDLVDETRSSLDKISAASAQINQLVDAIAEAAAAQSQEEEAVSYTMVEVAKISQQTSAAAISVSASFEELLEVAQKLQESVDRFKVE